METLIGWAHLQDTVHPGLIRQLGGRRIGCGGQFVRWGGAGRRSKRGGRSGSGRPTRKVTRPPWQPHRAPAWQRTACPPPHQPQGLRKKSGQEPSGRVRAAQQDPGEGGELFVRRAARFAPPTSCRHRASPPALTDASERSLADATAEAVPLGVGGRRRSCGEGAARRRRSVGHGEAPRPATSAPAASTPPCGSDKTRVQQFTGRARAHPCFPATSECVTDAPISAATTFRQRCSARRRCHTRR